MSETEQRIRLVKTDRDWEFLGGVFSQNSCFVVFVWTAETQILENADVNWASTCPQVAAAFYCFLLTSAIILQEDTDCTCAQCSSTVNDLTEYSHIIATYRPVMLVCVFSTISTLSLGQRIFPKHLRISWGKNWEKKMCILSAFYSFHECSLDCIHVFHRQCFFPFFFFPPCTIIAVLGLCRSARETL